MTQYFSFDEVIDYLRGAKGRHISVIVSAGYETSVHASGELVEVFSMGAGRSSPDLSRYRIQVGSDSGFLLSPHDFLTAFIDIYDPMSYALRIRIQSLAVPSDGSASEFGIVIRDERIKDPNDGLP